MPRKGKAMLIVKTRNRDMPKTCVKCNQLKPAYFYDNDKTFNQPYKVCKPCRELVSRKKAKQQLFKTIKERKKQDALIEKHIQMLYQRMRRQTRTQRNYVALLKKQLVGLTYYPVKYAKKKQTLAKNEADLLRWEKAYALQVTQLRATGRHEHLIDCYNQQS